MPAAAGYSLLWAEMSPTCSLLVETPGRQARRVSESPTNTQHSLFSCALLLC